MISHRARSPYCVHNMQNEWQWVSRCTVYTVQTLFAGQPSHALDMERPVADAPQKRSNEHDLPAGLPLILDAGCTGGRDSNTSRADDGNMRSYKPRSFVQTRPVRCLSWSCLPRQFLVVVLSTLQGIKYCAQAPRPSHRSQYLYHGRHSLVFSL
jgi:hypothetical protein